MDRAIRQAPLSLIARPLTPEALLAGAVLGQAVLDARNHALPRYYRETAKAFLLGDDGLEFWAALANLPAALVREHARRYLQRRAQSNKTAARLQALRREAMERPESPSTADDTEPVD